jgi:hypothetical protein
MVGELPASSVQSNGKFSHSSVLVGDVTEEKTRPIQSVGKPLWFALINSLAKSGIFKSVLTNGKSDYRFEASVDSHREMGAIGVFTAILQVHYYIIDATSAQTVWSDTVLTHQDSGVDLTDASEGAVRNNLRRMLSELASFSQLNEPRREKLK